MRPPRSARKLKSAPMLPRRANHRIAGRRPDGGARDTPLESDLDSGCAMTTLHFKISGMSCGGCANSVRSMLSQQLGVDKDRVEVSFEDGTATVKMDAAPGAAQVESALKTLNEQDFPASVAGGFA